MAKAKIILKRRKSVRNTEKITRTMEMVSTAKYKQSHSRIANSAPYQEKLRELMAGLGGAGESVSHPLLESRPVKRSVVLLITSNRGLCGGYNSNLISRAVDVLREEEGAGIRTDLHVIGTKGISFFRYRNRELAAAHDDFDDKSGYAQVNRIAGDFLRLYTEGEVDRVTVIY
ncbi:MAG: F0F1 ATP synthase subunit gamma, partial [Gemmatimonadota bacterium]|nr:F0F1 ATP synthase subunit gamma [Gemmatimonadota bacterium]